MARVHLGLGGNIGDVRATIAAAVARLEAAGIHVVARSGDYRTPPWGKLDQPAYVNAAVAAETTLPPAALLDAVLTIERGLGRERLEKWGPRRIDIDILTYDDQVIDTPGLVVPHPYVLERAFVLLPLCEIAPDLEIAGTRIADAAARVDGAGIEKLD